MKRVITEKNYTSNNFGKKKKKKGEQFRNYKTASPWNDIF